MPSLKRSNSRVKSHSGTLLLAYDALRCQRSRATGQLSTHAPRAAGRVLAVTWQAVYCHLSSGWVKNMDESSAVILPATYQSLTGVGADAMFTVHPLSCERSGMPSSLASAFVLTRITACAGALQTQRVLAAARVAFMYSQCALKTRFRCHVDQALCKSAAPPESLVRQRARVTVNSKYDSALFAAGRYPVAAANFR